MRRTLSFESLSSSSADSTPPKMPPFREQGTQSGTRNVTSLCNGFALFSLAKGSSLCLPRHIPVTSLIIVLLLGPSPFYNT